MAKLGWVLGVLLAGAGIAGAADPETVLSPQPLTSAPEWMTPAVGQAPPDRVVDEGPPRFNFEGLLGLPMAVRLEAIFFQEERVAITVEGVAGLYVIVPFVGAGTRLLWSPCHGQEDSFQLNPGLEIDAVSKFPFVNDHGGAVITPDVEFLWLHDFRSAHQSEVGLDLGGGVRADGNPGFIPRVSVILGMRF